MNKKIWRPPDSREGPLKASHKTYYWPLGRSVRPPRVYLPFATMIKRYTNDAKAILYLEGTVKSPKNLDVAARSPGEDEHALHN